MKISGIIGWVIIVLLLAIGTYLFSRHWKANAWLNKIEKTTAHKKHGIFMATDKTGTPIALEWKIINARSAELLETTKSLSDFMVQAWVPIEVDYLKEHPEEVVNKEHLTSFRPLFEHGIEQVDWQQVNALMAQLIKSMLEADPKDFFGEHDLSIFVIAKDRTTGKHLGFIQYLIKQEYPYGTVNLGNLAVDQEARNRGLGKILTSSLYALLPTTKRIFLYTRTTNEIAQKAYLAYGFKLNKEPITDPIFATGWYMFEYKSNESDTLKKESEKLKE